MNTQLRHGQAAGGSAAGRAAPAGHEPAPRGRPVPRTTGLRGLLVLLLVPVLAACSTQSPGPLEGTWSVTEPFPVTVSFREGEAEVMGKVRKVTYIRYWDKVTVVHDNDSRYDYVIVDDDTLRSESGTLRRVPDLSGQ